MNDNFDNEITLMLDKIDNARDRDDIGDLSVIAYQLVQKLITLQYKKEN